MEPYNFKDKINTYIKTNPQLSNGELGVLLLIDNIYQEVPIDISDLRKINTYFDPKNVDASNIDQITILKLVRENISDAELKKRLSKYLDMKYSCRGHSNTYEENMEEFKQDSEIAQQFLREILETASLPDEIKITLGEMEDIQHKDLFELVNLYRLTDSKRMQYEILRKIAIIDILTRIRKNYLIKDIDYATNEVLNVFAKGLGVKKTIPEPLYFWIDELEKVKHSKSYEEAKLQHGLASMKRKRLALREYPIQVFTGKPAETKQGNNILYMEVRNKLKKDGKIFYSSALEKIIRKNLEFPTQIHDIIGIRLVVEKQEDIITLISELETFIGGASLRKKEKNSTTAALHKFDRRPISKYSAKEYFVWKAVYDVALKSSTITELKHLLKFAKEQKIKGMLEKKIEYYMKRPVNYIVEVQIQDLDSYLLSIAKGSPTDHTKLKMKQIRTNSFYKIFPKEIYEPILLELRNAMLTGIKKPTVRETFSQLRSRS